MGDKNPSAFSCWNNPALESATLDVKDMFLFITKNVLMGERTDQGF
jgi:hypothetical protein